MNPHNVMSIRGHSLKLLTPIQCTLASSTSIGLYYSRGGGQGAIVDVWQAMTHYGGGVPSPMQEIL